MGRHNVFEKKEKVVEIDEGGDSIVTIKLKLEGQIHSIYIDGIIYNNQEEHTKMTNRRTVKIELIDDDAGLPVEKSLVATFDNVLTEDSNEVTIQELLMGNDVGVSIAAHNSIRGEIVNQEILNRTGQVVKLLPVKLKQLRWFIK